MSSKTDRTEGPRRGVVTVVLVNYKGAQDTITALRAFDDVDWPREQLELLVVDNDSQDGSVEEIRRAVPEARVVDAGGNTGFAGGCNLGVRHATGEYVAFLNNDARPGRDWIRAAVEVLAADTSIGAVASKVLDWEGERIDYVDGSLTWFGMGYKREVEKLDTGEWDTAKDVLFGTGAAMFMRADLFREVGGFDERFFMFYEDVDLGWRLNLLGYRVRYVPGSVAYHKHHVTMKKYGNFRESYLLERNALMSMYKNLDDESLARALPAAMALAVRRSFARADVDTTTLDLQRSPGNDDVGTLELPKMALTGPYAIDYFVEQLESLAVTRAELQKRRRRPDTDLFPLFRQTMEPAYAIDSYLEAHRVLVAAFDIASRFATRRRILVVTGEPLKATMAGPAIRAWEIARTLAPDHEVRLASTTSSELEPDGFTAEYLYGKRLVDATEWADVIIFQGFLLEAAPWLKDSDKIVVADIYDPMHLEQLEQAKDQGPGGREMAVRETTRALNEQIARADLMLCASEKQRDFWLGQLAAQGRVNPAVYDEDESLRSLLSVVPFGIADTDPVQKRHAIKGVTEGIGPDDKVILWGGGIYNWFDPLTLIRAVDVLRREHPEVRLYFLGLKHPNPGVPEMKIAWRTRELAAELGLVDKHVFFNEGWVPYDERADYLLDADLGVSTHFEHIETAFSFRTRILDYLWTTLPIVATGGDTFGELIREHDLGRVVPPQDVDALVDALEQMLYDEAAIATVRSNVRAFAESYRWERVLQPLVEFCRSPRRAADLATRLGPVSTALHVAAPPPISVWGDIALFREYMARGGVREVARRAAGRVRRVGGMALGRR